MRRSIGILLTNPDRRAERLAFPNDGDQVANLLRRYRPIHEYVVYDAVAGTLPASVGDHDGYVITGSPASVLDDDPWIPRLFDFIRMIDAARTPMVGLCFGHQAIAVALGGKVERATRWDFGVSRTTYIRPLPWMRPQQDTIDLHAAHHDVVTLLPPGLTAVGFNPFCSYAACAKGDTIFTTQYHPEMPAEFALTLADWFEDELGADAAQAARVAIAGGEEGRLFGEWMIHFFEYPRD